MAVPVIDSINWENFRYRPVYTPGHHFRGIFEWGFLYKESKVPEKELNKRLKNSEPYWSPTHAGGLFAMDRNYFFELGAYDPGLQIWGGENFELSFKIWQCGGKVEWVPCSHVGHVYRMHMPYNVAVGENKGKPIILQIWQCGGSIEWVPCSKVGHVYRNAMPYGFGKINPKIPIILINYMRVVEVWLDDEFKDYFYNREPSIRGYPIGDITQQLAFKKEHKCKSFKWFMDNIAYEVYEKFPPPPPNVGWGEIKEKHGFLCWDTMGQHPGGKAIGLSTCHHFGGNQMFRLNTKGQMGVGERCIDYAGGSVSVAYCPVQPTGPWQLDKSNGMLKHTEQGRCISSENGKLLLKSCDPQDLKQQWEINNVHIWQR